MQNRFITLIEFVVPPSNGSLSRLTFPDLPYLRGAFIFGIETYTVNDMTLSPQGNTPISSAVLKKSYLTLYTSDPILGTNNLLPSGNTASNGGVGMGEWIQQVPLSTLHLLQNSANDPFERMPFLMNGQTVMWDKSFVSIDGGVGNGSGANVSYLFKVSFVLNPLNSTN